MFPILATALLALSAQSPAPPKIPLAILYAGAPGSAREADWLAYLRENFATADSVSLRDLKGGVARGYDVVVADWAWRNLEPQNRADADGASIQGLMRIPVLRPEDAIERPMVLVGGIDAEIELKTKLRGH